MEFIYILIIVVIAYICSSILSTRKFVNLKVLVYGIMCLVGIGIMGVTVYATFSLLPTLNESSVSLMIIVIFVVLTLIIILLTKNYILCSIRVIDYYIHRKKIFENGHSEVGTITDIKTLGFHRNDFVYYLIIDFKGKQIRSLCFLDNIYSIGEDIDILVYKNHNYIILKN